MKFSQITMFDWVSEDKKYLIHADVEKKQFETFYSDSDFFYDISLGSMKSEGEVKKIGTYDNDDLAIASCESHKNSDKKDAFWNELEQKAREKKIDTRPSWTKTYFDVAKIVSRRSPDTHTKVGAVIVKDGVIVGTGYNGSPRGCKFDIKWDTPEKYDWVIHAELNAIANVSSVGVSVVGADIYLTHSPCHDCIKLLIQHRINSVKFLEKYRDYEQTKKIADSCGFKIEQISYEVC